MRRFIVISIAVGVLVAIVALNWRPDHSTKHGFTLTRYGDETIRISWGTPSGVDISPKSTMKFFLGWELEMGSIDQLPSISAKDDVWMYDLQPESLGGATPASYINPLNEGAFDSMFSMIELCKSGNNNADTVTRIAARNYIYLGWVVMDRDEIRSLKSALADRSKVPLNKDISTSNGVLCRLSPGVEKKLAQDPDDLDELADLRRAIPVMFETLDPKAGHPCNAMHVLYLDGHIERIPVGNRFPATQTFIDTFPPPKLSH